MKAKTIIITISILMISCNLLSQSFVNKTRLELKEKLSLMFQNIEFSDTIISSEDWTLTSFNKIYTRVEVLRAVVQGPTIYSYEFFFYGPNKFCDGFVTNLHEETDHEKYYRDVVSRNYKPWLFIDEFDIVDKWKAQTFKPKRGKKTISRRRVKLVNYKDSETKPKILIWNYRLTRKAWRKLKRNTTGANMGS